MLCYQIVLVSVILLIILYAFISLCRRNNNKKPSIGIVRVNTTLLGGDIGGASISPQDWVKCLNDGMKELRAMCKDYKMPNTFLDMWLLEQVGHKKYSWSNDDALYRCLERYNKEHLTQKISDRAKELFKPLSLQINNSPVPKQKCSNDIRERLRNKDPNAADRVLLIYTNFIRYTSQGMQLAVPPKVYEEYKTTYNITLEGFASPINHYFDRFCSAFPDVDKPYGSIGSFFDTDIKENVVANPPFEEEVMEACIDKLFEAISNNHITAILIVPRWDDSNCVMKALSSKYLKDSKIVDISDTGYISYDIKNGKKVINSVDTYRFILSE